MNFRPRALGFRNAAFFVLFVYLAAVAANDVIVRPPSSHDERRRCQEITIPMCRGIGYNLTSIPNQFFHETQEEAGLEVHQFWPLVEIQCSPDLLFFVCSLYVPLCVPEYQKPLPPCRSLCERAKSGCAPVMAQHNFPWPERMRCDKLPVYGDKDHLCMDINVTSDRRYRPETTTATPSLVLPSKTSRKPPMTRPDVTSKELDTTDSSRSCRQPLVQILATNDTKGYFNRLSTGGVLNCVLPCRSVYFSSESEKQFIKFWLLTWSVVCSVCTLMTLLTFVVDTQRYRYPERPIIIMTFCYLLMSIGYLVRIAVGHENIACDGSMLRYGSAGPLQCIVVFVLIYFFGMASAIWWVILCFAWFLSSCLKWSSEAITKCAQRFHQVAWILAAMKTVAIISISGIDGDPVAGVCSVGNTNLNMFRGFVVAPLVIYLLLGLVFLMVGFVSMAQIRNVIKSQQKQAGNGSGVQCITAQSKNLLQQHPAMMHRHNKAEDTDKLGYLMIRLAILSVLYVVQMSTLIGCYFYEQHNREEWERNFTCDSCAPESKPNFTVFLIKYLSVFLIGITLSGWTWTRKSIDAWRRCCMLRCCKQSQSNAQEAEKQLTNATTLMSINGTLMHSMSRGSQLTTIAQTPNGLLKQDAGGMMRIGHKNGSSSGMSTNGMMPVSGSVNSPLIAAHTKPNISPATTGSIVM